MKTILIAFIACFFCSGAWAQPSCTLQAPTAVACQAPAVNLQPTDVLLGQQANGPNRPNQNVQVPVSSLLGQGANLTAPNIFTAPNTFAVGSISGPWTTSTRPSSPSTGTTGYNSTIGSYETWNGTAWVGTVANLTAPGPIGSVTPNTVASTSLSASGAVSGAGFTNLFAAPPAIGSGTPNTLNGLVTATSSPDARALTDRAAQTINVLDMGANGDLVSFADGVYTAGNAAFSSASTTFSAVDIGKPIYISGAGTNGVTLATTVATFVSTHAITLAANPSASSTASFISSAIVVTGQAGGGSYAPGDTVTIGGGTFTTAAVLTVLKTKLVSATINTAGTGGTNSGLQPCVLTGTTGTGRLFRVNATVAGNILTAIGTNWDAGDYSVNPTTLTSEPVTGCGLTGATLAIAMGVSIPQVTTAGIYAALPSQPVTQSATSGSGTGATFTMINNPGGLYALGTDNTAALSAAVALSNSLYTQGIHACLYFPARDSRFPDGSGYLIASSPTQFAQLNPGCVIGDGPQKSMIRLGGSFAGDLFSWSDPWFAGNVPFGGSMPVSKNQIGVILSGIGVVGDTMSPAQQNAFHFYDHADNILFQNVDCWFVHGYCLAMGGEPKNDVSASVRESRFYNLRVVSSGSETISSVYISNHSVADATDELEFFGLQLLRCNGKCMQISPAFNGGASNAMRFFGVRAERSFDGDDLIVIGDQVLTGLVNTIYMYGFDGEQSQLDHAIIRMEAPSASVQPYDIEINGAVGGGTGVGVSVDAGRLMKLVMGGVVGTPSFRVGPSSLVSGGIIIDSFLAVGTTYVIDPTSVGLVFTNLRTTGDPTALGSLAVNIQPGQSAFGNTATGANCIVLSNGTSKCIGTAGIAIGTNLSANTNSILLGTSHVNTAVTTLLTGSGASDNGVIGHNAWATNQFSSPGDSQLGAFLFKGISVGTVTPIILTTNDSNSPNAGDLGNPRPDSGNIGLLFCLARDTGGSNDLAAWEDPHMMIAKGLTAADTTLKLSALTQIYADTGASSWTLTATADTTNGGVSLAFAGQVTKTIRVLCAYSPIVELQ